jgi:tetratricopeptide (TPR) repeat protein
MRIFDLQKALDLHRIGQLAEAERLYLRLLKEQPGHEDVRRLLAVLKHQTGRSREALADLDALLKRNPLFPEAMANRGVVLAALGRPDEAEAQFRQVLGMAPGFPDALGPLVRLLLAEERLDEAERLLAQTPQGFIQERAALLHKQGRSDQALALLDRALLAHPGDSHLLATLVPVLTILGRHEEAIEAGRAALALDPRQSGLRLNLALALLDAGRLEEGWREFAHRWESPDFPSHPRHIKAPRWDGRSSLAEKTVLVWREQGIGDEIIFASALPDLIAQAGLVVVECSPKLVPLFARSFPQAQVRPENRTHDPAQPGIDFHLPMGDLFPFLRPSLSSFPERPAYLVADPGRAESWKHRLAALGPEPKIGIAWKSTLATPTRTHNFLPSLSEMDALLRTPGVRFVNLQPKASPQEIEAAAQRTGAVIHRFDDLDLFDDLDGTAALMAGLDKVAAIGTATAILSAALGVPTGMFLFKHAQWDPMGTGRIPWLPKATLFRRFWNEGWQGPVSQAAAWLGERQTAVVATVGPQPAQPVSASGAETLLDQATAAHLAGRKDEAESLYRAVLARDSNRVEAMVNLAAILDESGRPQQALPLLEAALRLSPNEPAIADNLARLLIRLERLDEAVPLLKRAIALEPGNAGLMNDLGNALRLLNELEESAAWLAKAAGLAPNDPRIRFNHAKTLRELGRCAEALGELEAIAKPDSFTLWEIGATKLQMGDLAGGWPLIENRPGGWRGNQAPDCRGKRVLVTPEQGIGDFLIYGSALSDLGAIASQVILAAPQKLHALFKRSFPNFQIVGEAERPRHDLALPLGSLFHVFRQRLSDFERSQPFLKADPAKTESWKRRLGALGSGFKLGLAWRSTAVTRERARHFPGSPARLKPLLDLSGIVPVSLQAQATASELAGLASFPDCDLFNDLDEAAALIEALDAVAANGSAIAMLAGALGKPTALLMRAHASWDRLGTNRLPWLPTAKLFDCAWNEAWEKTAQSAADWIRSLQRRSNV